MVHSHRFRDSFAVGLLTAGTSVENVSRLLGHTSIKTTEQFYSPWIKTRQDALGLRCRRCGFGFHSGTKQEQRLTTFLVYWHCCTVTTSFTRLACH